jgi:putative transposase
MDHYSKMILGYKIENSNSEKAIKGLLSKAYHNYKPNNVQFLTDGGTENVNTTFCNFLSSLQNPIQHLIAQKTVTFSNSMIEAFNRTLKHQFLYPKHPNSKKQLEIILQESIEIYNNSRPQMNLGGNTLTKLFMEKLLIYPTIRRTFTPKKCYELNKIENLTV